MSPNHKPGEDGGGSPEHRSAGGEVARLTGELARLARNSPDELLTRVARLTIGEQAELALRLPAAQRIELMLHAPKPMRLVRSLPDTDLYLTVREVGPADACPVLALASASQLQHLIDLEAWRGDRFDGARAGAWIALFLEAGEPTLRRFIRQADDELLILLCQRWIRVEQIEYEDGADQHGHGEGDAGTEAGMLTPDGYYRFAPLIPEHGAAIQRLLQFFFLDEAERYRQILWSTLWEVTDEIEEEALRWRQSRLEEHGFPDREEALSIYAAPEGTRVHATVPNPTDPDGLKASRSFLMVLPRDSDLVAAIESLDGDSRERVLYELLSLANRILVADAADTGDPHAHRSVIDKAAGYMTLALDTRGTGMPGETAAILHQVPVIELFREGYAQVVELQTRARKLVRSGWAAAHPTALKLLDSPVRERLEGLLESRPFYLELTETGGEGTLREFRSSAELQETRVAVEMAEVLGRLLVEQLGLDLERFTQTREIGDDPLRFSALLTTLLAWHSTRSELRGDPLPSAVAADFLRTVASRRTAPPEAPARTLGALLERLTRSLQLNQRELSMLQGYGRYCLERLRAECGALDPGVPIDRRAVRCLIVDDDEGLPATSERRTYDE